MINSIKARHSKKPKVMRTSTVIISASIILLLGTGVGVGVYFIVKPSASEEETTTLPPVDETTTPGFETSKVPDEEVTTTTLPRTTTTRNTTPATNCHFHDYCDFCTFTNQTEICETCTSGYYQFGLTDHCYKQCETEYDNWVVTCEEMQQPSLVECKFQLTDNQTCLEFGENFDLTTRNYVSFSWKEIGRLHANSFDGVDKQILYAINLEWNKIEKIPGGIFKGMYEMRELKLSHNLLNEFDEGVLVWS